VEPEEKELTAADLLSTDLTPSVESEADSKKKKKSSKGRFLKVRRISNAPTTTLW